MVKQMHARKKGKEVETESRFPQFRKKQMVLIGLLVLFIFVTAAVLLRPRPKKTSLLLPPKPSNSKSEQQSIVEQVGALMELPKDAPTLATVADKTKLSSEQFFSKAENGDKVLIYTKAKKAILYRPSQNKIIEVSLLNIPDAVEPATASGAVAGANVSISGAPLPSPTNTAISVTILNGTGKSGLASKTEGILKQQAQNYKVVSKGNAAKRSYTQMLVVDVNGTKSQEAQALVKILNGKLSELPEGETKPASDLLIIAAE